MNASACKQIEEGPTWDGVAEDAEQRFPDPLGSRPEFVVNDGRDFSATQRAGHNSNFYT